MQFKANVGDSLSFPSSRGGFVFAARDARSTSIPRVIDAAGMGCAPSTDGTAWVRFAIGIIPSKPTPTSQSIVDQAGRQLPSRPGGAGAVDRERADSGAPLLPIRSFEIPSNHTVPPQPPSSGKCAADSPKEINRLGFLPSPRSADALYPVCARVAARGTRDAVQISPQLWGGNFATGK